MTNYFTSLSGKAATLMTLATFAIAGSATAFADVDLGAIELGKIYDIPGDMERVTGTFTAPKTGKMKMTGVGALYTDAARTEVFQGLFNGIYGSDAAYVFDVTEGTTYYYGAREFTPAKMTMNMKGLSIEALHVAWVEPSPSINAVYNLGAHSNIQICLNQENVQFDGVEFWYIDIDGIERKRSWSNARISDKYLNITNVGSTLTTLLNDFSMMPLNNFGFRIKGLRTEEGTYLEGTEDGLYEIQYQVSGIPVTITEQKYPENFLSYWPVGDPDGIVTLKFSKNLSNKPGQTPIASISCGNVEGQLGVDFYREEVPVTVEGNTVTVDLTGKRRTLSDMFSGTTEGGDRWDASLISLSIAGIRDTYGVPVQTVGGTATGSIAYGLQYKEIEKASVAKEAIPADGEDLSDTAIELWFSGVKNFSFDGFTVSYKNADGTLTEVLIDIADVDVKYDNADGSATYNFNIPQEAVAGKDVVITPTNFKTLDGYDYLPLLITRYNGFVLLYSEPSAETDVTGFSEGSKIVADFNISTKYPDLYATFELKDLNPEEGANDMIVAPVAMQRLKIGDFEATLNEAVRLYRGHTYQATFSAWENEADFKDGKDAIGSAVINWYGQTPVYVFSDVILESLTPAEGSTLTTEDRVFNVVFDGIVHIDDKASFLNGGVPFEKIEAVGENITTDPERGTLSPAWSLTVGQEFMDELEGNLMLTFAAVDASGVTIQGNHGIDEESCFLYEYVVLGSFVDFAVSEPEAGSTIDTLDHFIVSSDKGIAYNNNPEATVKVYNAEGDVVATVSNVEARVSEEDLTLTLCVNLDKSIIEAGVYTCVFEKGAFAIGSGEETWRSASKSFEVTVSGLESADTIGVSTDAVTVYNLQGVKLLDNADADALSTLVPGIYIINGKKVVK